MNSLNGFLRRLLPHRNSTRSEYAFELLRSTSAREFKKNARSGHLPRFYSHHDQMPSIAPPQTNSDEVIEVLGEGSQGMPEDQSALLGFINGAGDSCDSPSCSSYGDKRILALLVC
ncbi:hypothetical protein Tcan_04526 [Toxocara canis]|uniref:Uncharacterized protein n=1 Tax=Toxocara canis TaxID=6265 RepID=A0A0B2VQ35_TOXCA|nr:hypothetical protein Tcan_04526 [Toxocara canis]